MLTGTKKAVYLGGASQADYAHGNCRDELKVGETYKLTFGSNWAGSISIDRIESDNVQILNSFLLPNDSSSFRYYFIEGFNADWLAL